MNSKNRTDAMKIFASTVCLVLFSIWIVSLRKEINADDVVSFSQAKDLIEFGSLRGWTYPGAPSFFPDILLSIPFEILARTPYFFHLVTAPVQVLIFVFACSLLTSKERPFAQTYTNLTISLIAIAVSGLLVIGKDFYFLIETAFSFEHHGFAAVLAVILYFYVKSHFKLTVLNSAALVIVVFLLGISDLYFVLWFGALLASEAIFGERKKFLAFTVAFSALAIFIFVVSLEINSSLAIQAKNSATEDYADKLRNVFHIAIILFFMISIFIKTKSFKYSKSLCIAAIFSIAVVCAAGLIHNTYEFRYLSITYIISAWMFHDLIDRSIKIKNVVALTSIIFLVALVAAPKIPQNENFQREIDCLSRQGISGSTVYAEYWPAKIVFEGTNRVFNLIQIDRDLNETSWNYNSRWKSLHNDNGVSYYLTDHLSHNATQHLIDIKGSELLCDGKIVTVKAQQ
ncbi:hypothetical protein OKW27_000977 [Paraburkholderia sp. 35.1]